MKQTKQQAEIEDYRLQVQEQELVARANKAEYETMHYYLEARKIEAEFFEVRDKEIAERKKVKEDYIKQIQEQVEAQNTHSLSEPNDDQKSLIQEVNEGV